MGGTHGCSSCRRRGIADAAATRVVAAAPLAAAPHTRPGAPLRPVAPDRTFARAHPQPVPEIRARLSTPRSDHRMRRNHRHHSTGAAAWRTGLLLSLLAVPPLGGQQTVIAQPPLRLQSERYEVLLVTRRTIGTLTDDTRLSQLIASCRRVMRVAPPDSAAAVQHRGWDWSSGPSADPLAVTLVVIPSEALFVSCSDRDAQDRIAAARGLRITYDSVYSAGRDIERVALWRDKARIIPTLSERTAIARLTPRGITTTGAGAVRLSVPVDELAPDTTGARSDLFLEVWNERDTLPDLVPIPWPVVAEAWQELMEWRAERAISAGARSEEGLLVTPEPADSALRVARQRYLDGDLAGANRALMPRLIPTALSRNDYRNARVQLALSLASVGDSSAARVLMGRVVAESPCFTLASDAPAYARRLVEGVNRAPARCTSNSLLGTAVKSTLLPGFGRPSTLPRKLVGAAAVGVIGGSLATGFSKASGARSTYEHYLAMDFRVSSRPADSARLLHKSAESQRQTAKTAMTVAAVVWAATVVESVLHEALLARSLRQVQAYGQGSTRGAGRGASLAPRSAPGQVGFSLFFF